MSQMDMDDQVGASVTGPIVLIVGGEAQGYLEDNEVLSVLYGEQAPARKVAYDEGRKFQNMAWELFYPYREGAEERLKLFERFPHVSVAAMPEFLESDEFYEVVFTYIVELSGMRAEEVERVRVVVATESMFEEGRGVMRGVMSRHFPQATAFQVDHSHRGKPARVELS